MRHYELMVVLSPILSAEEVAGSKDRIKVLIDQQGGTITREDQWGMRRLAYPIRKAGQTFLEGNYLLTHFATEGVLSRDLEGQLNLSEDVLRYLVVKSEPPKPVQAPPADEAPSAPEGAEVDGASAPTAAVEEAPSAEAEGEASAAVEDAPVAAVEEASVAEAGAVEDVEAAVPEADTDLPESESVPEASIEDTDQGEEEPIDEGGSADSIADESDDGSDEVAEEEPAENAEDGETRP